MKDGARTKHLILFIAILVIAGSIAPTVYDLKESGEYFDLFYQYCPMNCPNSLWICTEGDIYFASDENGETLGATRVNGEIAFFEMDFDWRNHGCM